MRFTLSGRRALVTGASSGIGRAIARELAARGTDLVVTARRRERLEALCNELGGRVSVDPIVVDLAREDGARSLVDEVEALGAPVDVLVNCAGFGLKGPALDQTWERERSMLVLNVLAVAELTKHFGRAMAERGDGRILQVASTVAFQPCPGYAAYAASKTFVLHHGEALAEELREAGVGVSVLCPGSTDTEFFDAAGIERNRVRRATSLTPDRVARAGVDAIVRNRRLVVPGVGNRLGASAVRFLPRRFQVAAARRLLR
ncbi:MAG: SDR family oxidoreductase [Planctomycetota bacterium]